MMSPTPSHPETGRRPIAASTAVGRRKFLQRAAIGLLGTGATAMGCRGRQTASVKKPGERDLVGSHVAGQETYGPLVDTAVGNLLARHSTGIQPAGFVEGARPDSPMRICFVGVENKSIEEMGDFKEQLYQHIDARILGSHVYQPVSRRFVEAGLRQCRLRPDELFIPQNMRTFTATMEQMGQPFDFLLFAVLTSGTTRSNKDYERTYLLTLEMVNIHNGQADKELAEIEKLYNVSAAAKLRHLNPLK